MVRPSKSSTSTKAGSGQETPCRYSLFSTALGWAGVLVSSKGIRRLSLPQETLSMAWAYLEPPNRGGAPEPELGSFPDIERRLKRYFRGEETAFDDSLDLVGTAFQKRTWEVSRTIPRGETRSYGWIAKNMGNPGSARAVGQAMRSNPVPIIVPCHRVIGRDGRMCGYCGPEGVELKRRLLGMERGNREW